MINRQSCYSALFKLKDAGIDISVQLESMQNNKGVPREVILFLRENSPQFQFYRYLQKYQKTLAKNLLDYKELSQDDKLITLSSFVTRVLLAVKYKNLDKSLLDEFEIPRITRAVGKAIAFESFEEVDEILKVQGESLKVFYKTNKEV